MVKYIVVWGNNPALSYEEFKRVLKARKISFTVLNNQDQGAVIQSDKLISMEILEHLGGTVKMAEVSGLSLKCEDLSSFLSNTISDEGKLYFGFSVYPLKNAKPLPSPRVHNLGIKIKKFLRQKGISSRFVSSKEPVLSSVIVKKNHLLDRGVEFVVWGDLIARTRWVQDFRGFGRRDYGRPSRDGLSGMLPPKLARIMINLSGFVPREDSVLVDPFCGSGTVLNEALMLGYKKIRGFDSSLKAVNDSIKNLKWEIANNSCLSEDKIDYKIKRQDVRTLSRAMETNTVDVFVCEPYLGPPQKNRLNFSQAKKMKEELADLYESAVIEMSNILKPGGSLVIVFPVFFIGRGDFGFSRLSFIQDFVFMNLAKIVLEHGFKQTIIGELGLPFVLAKRGSIIYGRSDQKVLREVCVFKKRD